MKNKLYVYNMNPNGTSDLLITSSDGIVLDSISEALFGRITAKRFGWNGDSLGNIEACYYGETVGTIEYSQEYETEEGEETQTLAEVVQDGDLSDITQVMEVDLNEVLEHIAVSPVSDGSETIETLKQYFKIGA